MPALKDAPPGGTPEQRLAHLVKELEDFLADDGRFPTLESKVKALSEWMVEEKKIDLKKVVEDLEKQKAQVETLKKSIRSHKGGLYTPGVESAPFDMHRAMVGMLRSIEAGGNHKKQFDQVRAGSEYEVMKATFERAEGFEAYDSAERKAVQQVGDDTLGGFFVPDQVIADMISAIYSRSPWISLDADDGTTRISVLQGLTGGNVKIPQFNGGVIAFWHGEEDAIAESVATVGEMTMTPKALGVLVIMTESMKRMQGYGFDALLRRDMIRAISRKLDFSIPYGLGGADQPLGIVNTPGIKIFQAKVTSGVDESDVVDPTTITDWPSAAVGFEALSKMQLGLEEDNIDMDETYAFISSPRFFTNLKNLKIREFAAGLDSESGFVIGAPMLTDTRLADIIGEFGKSTQIPTNLLPGASIGGATTNTDAKHTDVFSGNLGEIVLGRWAGLEFSTDNGLGKYFASGKTQIKMVMHADIGIRQPRAIMCCPNAKVRP